VQDVTLKLSWLKFKLPSLRWAMTTALYAVVAAWVLLLTVRTIRLERQMQQAYRVMVVFQQHLTEIDKAPVRSTIIQQRFNDLEKRVGDLERRTSGETSGHK
jgi:cytochrome c-type biogenesis protein CcmH/NrfG